MVNISLFYKCPHREMPSWFHPRLIILIFHVQGIKCFSLFTFFNLRLEIFYIFSLATDFCISPSSNFFFFPILFFVIWNNNNINVPQVERHAYPRTVVSLRCNFKSACWSRTKRTSSSSHWKLSSSRQHLAEKLLSWR
jgi:hypothetical protein